MVKLFMSFETPKMYVCRCTTTSKVVVCLSIARVYSFLTALKDSFRTKVRMLKLFLYMKLNLYTLANTISLQLLQSNYHVAVDSRFY